MSDKIWDDVSTIKLPFVLGEPEGQHHSYGIKILCSGGEFLTTKFQELFNRGNENEYVE